MGKGTHRAPGTPPLQTHIQALLGKQLGHLSHIQGVHRAGNKLLLLLIIGMLFLTPFATAR